jgi:hypothetical protein
MYQLFKSLRHVVVEVILKNLYVAIGGNNQP